MVSSFIYNVNSNSIQILNQHSNVEQAFGGVVEGFPFPRAPGSRVVGGNTSFWGQPGQLVIRGVSRKAFKGTHL